MSKWKIASAAAALLALGSVQALAQQSYPNRHITMVVPFAAGGPTDIVGRIVAEHMSRTLGQQVVVENAAGAAGTTGATRVAKAEPDGYTIMVGPMSTMSFTPALYPKLAFNPLTDFEPIGVAASAPIMLVVNNAIPATKLSEFTDYMKANAAKLTNGNAGVGSTSHLACLLLNNRVGASITHGALPRHRTRPARRRRRAGRLSLRPGDEPDVAGQGQRRQAAGGAGADPFAGAAGRADGKRSRHERHRHGGLERPVRAEGNAARDHREAERRPAEGDHRSGLARTVSCNWAPSRRRRASARRRRCASSMRPTWRNGAR